MGCMCRDNQEGGCPPFVCWRVIGVSRAKWWGCRWSRALAPGVWQTLDDWVAGAQFVEADGTLFGVLFDLEIEGWDRGLNFESFCWCCFEGCTYQVQGSSLDFS